MEAPNQVVNNRKYYINYENEERECSNCREIKPFKDFSKTMLGYPRPVCKTCRSLINFRKEMEKKLEMYPHLYNECQNEQCNYIWKKEIRCLKTNSIKSRRDRCIKCGTKVINESWK